MSELVVTMNHVRKAGLCSRGAKAWFTSHEIDFRGFLRNGMPLSQAQQINDAFAQRVVQQVVREGAGENDGR